MSRVSVKVMCNFCGRDDIPRAAMERTRALNDLMYVCLTCKVEKRHIRADHIYFGETRLRPQRKLPEALAINAELNAQWRRAVERGV